MNGHLEEFQEICQELQYEEKRLLPLCAAENAISPFGKIPLDSFIQEKYIMGGIISLETKHNFMEAEHLFKFYSLLNRQCFELFQSNYSDARTLSGVNAVMILLMSLFQPGSTLLISSEDSGGHGSMPLICHRLGIKFIYAPFDYEIMDFDYEKIKALRQKVKIDGMLICPSDILFQPSLQNLEVSEDFIIIYDATQTLGLIAGKSNSNPFHFFSNEVPFVLMGATHKTLPGPTSGLIMTNNQKLMNLIDTKINPDYLRNVQFHQILSLILVLIEMEMFGEQYSKQIIDNANKLGRYLEKRGVQVIRARNDLYTDTHQIFISMKENEIMRFLHRSQSHGISLNGRYKRLYRDSGIRIGVQQITRHGWEENEFEQLADVFYQLTQDTYNYDEVEKKLNILRSKKDVHYTFSEQTYHDVFNCLHDG